MDNDWNDDASFQYNPSYKGRLLEKPAAQPDLDPDEEWDTAKLKAASLDIRKNNISFKNAAKKHGVRQKDLRLFFDNDMGNLFCKAQENQRDAHAVTSQQSEQHNIHSSK
eukprot:TRINITY_DN1976_c0_g1_i2.p3 TRINITY_DN1976_c0_g1~~TRINITY_DN1976_c0_g1_i2.p3  ORF type:complete len:110 (+),score=20.71 TRINITY_DN1976_c0_g1_i2:269-598(+)